MSLRDSESDFGGRLGASLTPRVPVARVQEPGEQNSGLVDIRALYAASVEQVMQRAQAARAWPPVVAFEPVDSDPVPVDEEPFVLPRRRLGWFSITVVLLVLATTGGRFVASSNVPEVVHAKTTLVPVVMRAKTAVVGVAIRAEAAVVTRVDQLTGRPVPVAAPVGVQPPEAPPFTPAPTLLVPASALALSPPAPRVGEAAPSMTVVDAKAAPVSTPPARAAITRGHAPPKAAADVRGTARAPKYPGATNVPAMAAAPAKAAAAAEAPGPAATKAAPEPARAPAGAPRGADSKPMSLEDMIRGAVEAESKRRP
jgi:hypothetical protein